LLLGRQSPGLGEPAAEQHGPAVAHRTGDDEPLHSAGRALDRVGPGLRGRHVAGGEGCRWCYPGPGDVDRHPLPGQTAEERAGRERTAGGQPGRKVVGLQGERVGRALDVGLGLRVRGIGEELCELGDVVGALLDRAPEGDLLTEALGLAGDLLRLALVVPEPGLDGARVELRDADFLGG